MHEIGVVRSMVKTVTDFAQANNIAEVTEIVLDIGELSLVIPKYVEDIYPVVVEDTFLKDTKLIINIIAFLCTFILVTIVVRAIVFALDIVSELPVLGAVNRLAGGVVGVAGALIIVWTLFVIITLLYTTDIGKQMFGMIESNSLLKMLYDFNPIMKLATILK